MEHKPIKYVLCLLLFLFSFSAFGQIGETAKAMFDTEIEKNLALINIEGKDYYDVVVNIKSVAADYFFTDKDKVKVKVVDKDGKTIWKRTLKNAYLFVFSSGQIQIGKKNFNQIIIQRIDDLWVGRVREKEGIY